MSCFDARKFVESIVLLCVFVTLCVAQGACAQSASFRYNGAIQSYLVPHDVSAVSVDVLGACGGNAGISSGGSGGRLQCTLAVQPGEVLYIYVGGAGENSSFRGASGGFNGGATGSEDGGGGGGATDIRIGGTGLSHRVVVAGGGGGACGPTHLVAKDYDRGGGGGGILGQNGFANGKMVGDGVRLCGLGGRNDSATGKTFRCGAFGEGGKAYAEYVGGGGGGGGWYGGNGGDECGGGGGSSFSSAARTSNVVHTQGYNSAGHGALTITPVASATNARDWRRDEKKKDTSNTSH